MLCAGPGSKTLTKSSFVYIYVPNLNLTMSNKHYQKWLLQMPVGFLLVGAGVIVIMYSANKRASDEWLIWGLISATIMTAGLGILGNAYIHKVKSDLIKKQRSRDNRSTFEEG